MVSPRDPRFYEGMSARGLSKKTIAEYNKAWREGRMSKTDELKELRAYNIGYDLGWYRAMESVSGDLQGLADAILNSATLKQIEQEGGDKPIFLARVMDILAQLQTMRNEKMPVLLLERSKINELGSKIKDLPVEAFKDPISFSGFKALDAPPKTEVEAEKS